MGKKKTLENIEIANDFDVCYVVIRNYTVVNPKTHKDEDYTQIIRVFKTEAKADAYVEKFKKSPLGGRGVTVLSIPTPYGDVDVD